jgi:hypothetical protein
MVVVGWVPTCWGGNLVSRFQRNYAESLETKKLRTQQPGPSEQRRSSARRNPALPRGAGRPLHGAPERRGVCSVGSKRAGVRRGKQRNAGAPGRVGVRYPVCKHAHRPNQLCRGQQPSGNATQGPSNDPLQLATGERCGRG